MNNKENILKSINDKQNSLDDLNKLITDYFNSDIEKENDLLKHKLDENFKLLFGNKDVNSF